MRQLRRIWIETATGLLFVLEFITNLLRHVGLGRRYYKGRKRLDKHTVVVTGANSGIGKETVLQFSKRGARVIMACRNKSLGMQAAEQIKKHNPEAMLIVMQLDLSSFESIHRFADHFELEEQKVDILVNNAGIMLFERIKSADGYEMQLATNHLGHFLLTKRLLPMLAKSPEPRVVTVSTIHHKRGRIHFDDLNLENSPEYDSIEAYCQSKLANVLFSAELARRVASHPMYDHIRTYSLNPGTINTKLTRNATGTTLYCALEPSLKDETGQYYSNCGRDYYLFCESTNLETARKLWDVSLKMVGLDDKGFF